MKTALALGALAALCQSVLALTEGTYTIGAASLLADEVLGDEGEVGVPLTFSFANGSPFQKWSFATKGSEREFAIQNASGGYINCGVELGTPCVSGTEEQVYIVEEIQGNGYELVSKQTGYFLRTVKGALQLAEYNNNSDEKFILTPA
ncbi:RICIN domain-containing protein [Aspergillus puulaauensis]|uniref:Ricin B lectin domain-containing protein n=1 Tax=Aspergillus puulaauensis TaxID=1220207 RepID=A0A7R7XVL9_9EURO|nr:uncharacterized protein APUU_60766S [Aspergillus puulaauensis]BCS27718.1 hypothetical protein APUU_60766S [Aspergillus puulaauensis]